MKYTRLAIALGFLASISFAQATELPVPQIYQANTNWCWAACSQMVLQSYGVSIDQSEIAAYACGSRNVPNALYGTTISTDDSVGTYDRIPVNECLKHFGNIDCTFYGRPLTEEELTNEIEAKAPPILSYTFTRRFTDGKVESGIIHFVVAYSDTGGLFAIRNPALVGITSVPTPAVQFTYAGL